MGRYEPAILVPANLLFSVRKAASLALGAALQRNTPPRASCSSRPLEAWIESEGSEGAPALGASRIGPHGCRL